MAQMLVSVGRREANFNINIGSFNENKKHSDKARWICIYPAYLNSKKTVSEGRQLPSAKCVENPTCNEIRDVLVSAGFRVELEPNKVYPKEPNKYDMLTRGRIRVQLKNEDETLVNPQYKDSKIIEILF
jgi:signal recognition particle subunit SRP19